MEIDVSQVTEAIDNLIRLVGVEVEEATTAQADKFVKQMKKATDYPFQSVPSYLLAHRIYPKLNPTEYPQGAVATFAAKGTGKASRVGNLEVFTGQGADIVQHFAGAKNKLLTILLMRSDVRQTVGGMTSVDVGYPKDVGTRESEETDHIPLVYFGTTKMVARPFIEKIVYSQKDKFMTAIKRAAEDAIRKAEVPADGKPPRPTTIPTGITARPRNKAPRRLPP